MMVLIIVKMTFYVVLSITLFGAHAFARTRLWIVLANRARDAAWKTQTYPELPERTVEDEVSLALCSSRGRTIVGKLRHDPLLALRVPSCSRRQLSELPGRETLDGLGYQISHRAFERRRPIGWTGRGTIHP